MGYEGIRVAEATKTKPAHTKVTVRKVGRYLAPTYDFIAKGMLGSVRNVQNITVPFLMSFLDLPKEEYVNLHITNPEMPKRTIKGKYVVLDILLETASHGTIHIEIQVKPIPHAWERLIEYNAQTIVHKIKTADKYVVVTRTISILIYSEGIMFHDDDNYFHSEVLMDKFTKTQGTDLVEFDIIELKKLPENLADVADKGIAALTDLYNWAKFFNAKTEKELEDMAMESPAIADAFEVLKELSEDEKMQKMAIKTEQNRRYIDDQIWGAEQRGAEKEGQKAARAMYKFGIPLSSIATELGHPEGIIQQWIAQK
ncbi:hypothetical protein FACS1894184_21090 [Clostridia bacterium]|nr:hypothetical protein FACS1894184_21090 [Clostridia bacterium]